MKRIFLTSALLLSFLSYSQDFAIIERYWKNDIREEIKRLGCEDFEPRHKKEKKECLIALEERLKVIDSLHKEEKKDWIMYFHKKNNLLDFVKYAKVQIRDNPEDSARVYGLLKSYLVQYMDHVEKCVNSYGWAMELRMIIIEKDPNTILNVIIRNLKESDFK